MNGLFSNGEKEILERLRGMRKDFYGLRAFTKEEIDNAIIKELLYDLFTSNNIEPHKGEFDALADDVQQYIKRSFVDFVEFLQQRKEE